MAYNELERRGTSDFPVEFFHIDHHHARYQMSAHWHSEVELIRVLQGSLSITLDDRTYCATPGDIFFINSETVHQGIPQDCVYECIVVHLHFLYNETHSCQRFIEQVINRECFIPEYLPREDWELYRCANALFDVLQKKAPGYEFFAIAAFYQFFGRVLVGNHHTFSAGSSSASDNKHIIKLKKVLLFIRQHYNEPITLSQMAEVVGMSPKYFGVFFKSRTGKTPFDYLGAYRIEKAARMLKSTDLNITEVAYACGFNDLSYFIKTFKNLYGISPGAYKKSI